jgi:hypothetical protein
VSQKYMKPIAGAQNDVIVPGPILGPCPPPTEIICIEAKKVFDFCFQEELLEKCFRLEEEVTEVEDCEIESAVCREIRDRRPVEGRDGLFLVSLQIDLILRLTLLVDEEEVVRRRRITIVKQVVLCAPLGTEVTCEVAGTCICVVQDQTLPPELVENGAAQPEPAEDEPNICCTVQLCITIQSLATVKILVPALGLCVPAECRVAPAFGGCPPMPPGQCFPETLGGLNGLNGVNGVNGVSGVNNNGLNNHNRNC